MGLGSIFQGIGALGGLGSLFGGHGGDGGPSPYTQDELTELGNAGGVASSLMGLGQMGQSQYQQYNPLYTQNQSGLGQYWSNLANNGLTDSQKSMLQYGYSGDFNNPFHSAMSSMTQNNFLRGFGLPGGNNSISAGANAYLQGQTANRAGQGQAQLGQMMFNLHPQALGNAANAYNQLSTQGLGLANEDFGRAGQMDMQLAGDYGNLDQRNFSQQMDYNNALGGGMGNLLGGLGGLAAPWMSRQLYGANGLGGS